MLLHHESPSGGHHQLASFLQNPENRRFQYKNTPVHRSYATLSRPTVAAPASRPSGPIQYPATPKASAPVETVKPHPDAMNLSLTRRTPLDHQGPSRQERGECFRCGSKEYLVRNCPHPDNPSHGSSGKLIEDSPDSIKSGDLALVKMLPSESMVAEKFSDYASLVRVIV